MMDLFAAEWQPAFAAPSPDTRLVLFADDEIRFSLEEVAAYLSKCANYAKRHQVYLVTGLFVHQRNLCLCLLGPDGMPLCRQGALQPPSTLKALLEPAEQLEVVPTDLGNLCLCVDTDLYHPQTARTAALKGADLLISIQRLDPAADTPNRLFCSAWNAAQSNNLYVLNYSAGSASVCCPAGVTRARDGWLVKPSGEFPLRFGMNLSRLDEIRQGLQLMEQINTGLIQRYAVELGGGGDV